MPVDVLNGTRPVPPIVTLSACQLGTPDRGHVPRVRAAVKEEHVDDRNKVTRTRIGRGLVGLVGTALLLIAASMLITATPASAATASRTTVDTSVGVNGANGFFSFTNVAYDQCLDAPNGVFNVVLKLSRCNNTDSELWRVVPGVQQGTVRLLNKRSRLCAEVNNATNIPGELVDQFDCNGSPGEDWVEHFVGGGYLEFEHAGTGLCLDTVHGPNSQLMQWYCGPSNLAQMWLAS
jgi:Ricin-type beta-trefoil lectin domain